MAGSVKATDLNGDGVWINLSNAMTVRRQGDNTRVTWPGGDDDKVRVKEAPEAFFKQLRNV